MSCKITPSTVTIIPHEEEEIHCIFFPLRQYSNTSHQNISENRKLSNILQYPEYWKKEFMEKSMFRASQF